MLRSCLYFILTIKKQVQHRHLVQVWPFKARSVCFSVLRVTGYDRFARHSSDGIDL